MTTRPTVPSPPAAPSHTRGLRPAWQPGQSGNPSGFGGRYAEVRAMAREASPEAMRGMIAAMSDPDPRVAVVARKEVLDRAWGKVREAKPGDDAPRPTLDLSHLTREELELLLKALGGPWPMSDSGGSLT